MTERAPRPTVLCWLLSSLLLHFLVCKILCPLMVCWLLGYITPKSLDSLTARVCLSWSSKQPSCFVLFCLCSCKRLRKGPPPSSVEEILYSVLLSSFPHEPGDPLFFLMTLVFSSL